MMNFKKINLVKSIFKYIKKYKWSKKVKFIIEEEEWWIIEFL